MSLVTQVAHFEMYGSCGQIVYYKDGQQRRTGPYFSKDFVVLMCRTLFLLKWISEEEYKAMREQIASAQGLTEGDCPAFSDDELIGIANKFLAMGSPSDAVH